MNRAICLQHQLQNKWLPLLALTWSTCQPVARRSWSRYDPAYGARPLKRTIQREVETVLAKRIISGEISTGDVLVADVVNERLVIASKGVNAMK